MKLYTEEVTNTKTIIWQEDTQGVPEQAVLIERLEDCIYLTQNGSVIRLNYDSAQEIGRTISKCKRPF